MDTINNTENLIDSPFLPALNERVEYGHDSEGDFKLFDKFSPPPDLSDEDLALRFSSRFSDRLRFVKATGRWLIWNGFCWKDDLTYEVLDFARQVCRDAAAEADKPGRAISVASAKTCSNVINLARSDRRHATKIADWDADPLLIGTPGGTIDLRDGSIRKNNRRDLITKNLATAPGGACPTWLEFLQQTTEGDQARIDYLQRFSGYCLTGLTTEHCIIVVHGPGRNGKSVFVNTLGGLFGDYHKTANMDAFTASNFERHPTELARLRGARLVTCVETDEGRPWAEARIKSLTGGDTIAARFMREDFFEFKPEFKLLIVGNHKPVIRNVDDAMRRRLHLVPFTATIPAEKRDPDLAEKLRIEWPGILAWAIEGAIAWRALGLSPPDAVRAATEAYLESEDSIEAWILDCCDEGPNCVSRTVDLWESWRTKDARGWTGISVKA